MKRIIKMVMAVVMTTMMIITIPMNAFAATGTPTDDMLVGHSDNTFEKTVTETLMVIYRDQANISHKVVFTISCAAEGYWSEGNYGAVKNAVFFTPTNATIDGQYVSMVKEGGLHQTSSTCYQDFKINYSEKMFIRVTVQCDEWGEVTLWAEEV